MHVLASAPELYPEFVRTQRRFGALVMHTPQLTPGCCLLGAFRCGLGQSTACSAS